MKRRDLVKKLQDAGWTISPGGKHEMAIHPTKPGKIPIPGGTEINEYTAKGILKSAGLK